MKNSIIVVQLLLFCILIHAQAQVEEHASDEIAAIVSEDALHYAARYAVRAGDTEMLKAAITAGADVNARDGRGWTALMYAVDNGYLLLVSQLLEAQADVNLRAPEGATALFMAAAHGHTEIIELLMKAGADVSVRDTKGTTPTDVARERYGDANAARRNGESALVIALLDGKTWAEVEEERVQVVPTVKQLVEEMVRIPAGEFRMGSRGRDADDGGKPIHRVTVPTFKLGKYEVTVGQFRAFVVATGYLTVAERREGKDGGCHTRPWKRSLRPWNSGHSWREPGYTVADDQPVVCVTWEDVQSFINWLNDRTGGNYRLPSEAEWEYAARAGSTTEYSWGDDIGNNLANCANDYCGDRWEHTAPAGSFPTNAWGLHDMHGNVTEWVQDCWHDSYEGAPKDGSAWTSGYCLDRVLRGGSWSDSSGLLRFTRRQLASAGQYQPYRSDTIGFRLAQGGGHNTEETAVIVIYDPVKAQGQAHDTEETATLVSKLVSEMVSIPGGTFPMGDLSGEGDDDERPVHSVTLLAFRLGRYEVTVDQFLRFVDASGYRTDAERNAGGAEGCSIRDSDEWVWAPGSSWHNPGYDIAYDQPVVCVSWNDARAFIDWLNDKTGGNYRLPSEAEWEYAARAGSTTKYHFGNDESQLCRYANHADSSTSFDRRNESCSDGVGERVAAVGQYDPNAYSLYDMHGNVEEWVRDCWNDSYEGAPDDGSTWMRGDCSQRVVRGGSWSYSPWLLRSAARSWYGRSSRFTDIGFRLAQDE